MPSELALNELVPGALSLPLRMLMSGMSAPTPQMTTAMRRLAAVRPSARLAAHPSGRPAVLPAIPSVTPRPSRSGTIIADRLPFFPALMTCVLTAYVSISSFYPSTMVACH